MSLAPPSGEQFEIAFGDQRATVVEVGGGLRSFSAEGRELLDGYAADEPIRSGRGQVLIPWPNRLEDGSYEFDGQAPPAPAHGAGAGERDPRPRAGRALDGRRARAASCGHGARPRAAAGVSVHGLAGHRIRALGERPERADDRDEQRSRRVPVRKRPASVPDSWGRPSVDSLVLSAPGVTVLIEDERGIPRGREPVDGTAVRLPPPARDRRDDARRRVHRPGARARTDARASSCGIRRAAPASASGWTRATGTCSSSPATRCPTSRAGASRSSR